MRVVVLICCLVSFGLGCVSPKPTVRPLTAPATSARTNSAPPAMLPANAINGRVLHVNAADRYCLVTFPLGQLPRPNSRFSAYRNGLKVAELRITGERLDQNVAADITAGEVQVGDEVRAN